MVKKASTKVSSSAASAESTPAKAPVKRVKKSVSTKQEEKVEVVEVAPEVPDYTQVDTENTAEASGVNDHIGKQFEGIIQTLSTFRCTITALQAQIRGLEKSVRREMKSLQKEAAKNRNKGNRRPSGFAKPSQVSSELCTFMKKEAGTEIARTEVTQYLIQYIKDNSLQFAGNKKIIVPDSTLKKLLNVKDGEEVTYFNLQRLMNRHFVKSSSSTSATTSA
jgi:chromatin remodeling complex protein RSC6